MAKTTLEKRLHEIPLFREYSARQIASVARLVTPIEVTAGRELTTQGKLGRELFVVLEGEAEVRRDGKVVATQGPGSFIGETALLLDRPRNATVVAASSMTVGVIEQRDFRQLLQQHPDLYQPLLEAIAKRLPDDNH